MPQTISKRPFGNGPAQGSPNPFVVPPVPSALQPSETQSIGQPPSCIEFFRDDSRIFVVGTYLLLDGGGKEEIDQSKRGEEGENKEGTTQKRIGSVVVYRMNESCTEMYGSHYLLP